MLNNFNMRDYILFPIINMEYTKAKKSEKRNTPPHSHPYLEIEYIISGKVAFHVNDKVYKLSAGNLVLITAGDIHHTIYEDTETEILIFTVGNQLPAYLLPGGHLFETKIIVPENRGEIDNTMKSIIIDLIEAKPYYKNIIETKILTLLYQVLRNETSPSKTQNYPDSFLGLIELRKRATVDEVIKQIHENIDSYIKISDIASKLFFTPQHLNRLFKEVLGVSPKQYELNYKITTAKSLLKGSNESIKAIAKKLGYDDVVHFYKIFKKHTGYTPAFYRNSD